MKKRILSLVLCAAMLLSMCLFLGAGVTNSLTVCDSSGEAVKRVDLPVNQKISLTAQAQSAAENDAYQWQIRAAKNVWANILGSDAQTLELSYPMVASALSEKNTVQIRCRLTSAETGEATFSDAVTVEVTAATAVDTPASADAAAAPVLRSPAKVAAAANDAPETRTIEIKYVLKNGTQAAPSWTATVAKGSNYSATITSPAVVGYEPKPSDNSITIDETNIQDNITRIVYYYPALVDFTVKYYQQNVGNDRYMLSGTVTKQGYTEDPVSKYATGTNGFDVNYAGFTRLLYDDTATIAADGSTVVELYYDRNYYLMNFNLDGGYGVEPIYARYDAPISVGTPTKPGYTFGSWTPSIPATMPAYNTSYTAKWTKGGNTAFTVAFYYENADDDGYTFMGSNVYHGTTGNLVNGSDYKDHDFTGRDTKHFTYNDGKTDKNVEIKGDGSTVVKVYFSRNKYTMNFYQLTCKKKFEDFFHRHKHTHTDYRGKCYTVTDTFSAKYNANIAQQYAKITKDHRWIRWDATGCTALVSYMPDNSNPDALKYWRSTDANTIYNVTYAYESENGKINHDGKKFTDLATSHVPMGFVGYSADYLPAVRNGYSPYTDYSKAASPGFQGDGAIDNTKDVTLYYYANTYTLRFMNAETELHTANVKYNFSIKSNSSFTPDASYAPNGMVFDCWCLDPAGAQPVDWSTQKMPAGDLVLYARWKPRIHTVKTYLTKVEMDEGKAPTNTWTAVPHGTAVTNPPADPERKPYKFVGWFYISDTGEEKAFDFSMPVNRDLNLYAKWSSNTLMEYTIHYKLKDGTSIADDTKGSALAGSTKTFEAKTGTQLNKGYQSGYFPTTSSHSITMDIKDPTQNEYTFVYVPKPQVEYTVKYLDKATGNPVVVNGQPTPDKTETTSNAVVTEPFKQIPGYAPDAYQKRLVLSAKEEENVLVFWYTKDDVHAPVQIVHEIQNIEGDGYTEYQSSTNLNGVIGEKYDETPLTIPGFKYNESASTASGELTAAGLVLTLKYDRIEYPYEFRFLEQGTNKVLKDSVTGKARYQAQVTQEAQNIPGYTLVNADSQAINIAIEDSEEVAKNNVKIFYYTEQTVNIKYQVVGSGTLNNYQEAQLKVLTGTVNGSTPTAAEGYKFVGWYTNEACTQPVNNGWVDDNNKLTPQKNASGQFEAATYYAKFERDVFDLTIEKTGEKIDQHQTFVFRVQGEGVDMQVVITGTNKQTIKNLPVGEYTITEDTNWSWKYTPVGGSATQDLKVDSIQNGAATVTFENENKGTNWLTSLAKAINTWAGDRAHEKTN